MLTIPAIGGNILTEQAQAWPYRTVCLLLILLEVLGTTKHPLCFAFLELAVAAPLDKVLGLNFLKTSLSNQLLISMNFASMESRA